MLEALQALVEQIESMLPTFQARRNEDALANDCFEAARYWRNLGRRVLDGDTRVNYPARAKGEFILLAQLREIVESRPLQEQGEFLGVLDAGEQLLNIVATIQPPKDGHLGFLRIARKHFAFLGEEFGFKTIQVEPTEIRFSSSQVYIELSHSVSPWLSCSFGPDVTNGPSYWIHDLLYMYGDERYNTLPERLELNTEQTVEDWVAFLAECFRRYGRPILSNEDGVMDQLAAAQAKRDAEYVREMELKYGSQTGQT